MQTQSGCWLTGRSERRPVLLYKYGGSGGGPQRMWDEDGEEQEGQNI